MSIEDAARRLQRMTAASTEPVICQQDLLDILMGCRLADAEGRAPGNDDWDGSYDMNLAAAEVFEAKAAAVSADFDFAADGASYKRSQKVDHFLGLAKSYRSKRAASFDPDFEVPDADLC